MKHVMVLLIRLYQLCISPFIGNVCRFTPSCSRYASEAFEKHGFFSGFWLTIKRLSKCHAWHPGGHDEVP